MKERHISIGSNSAPYRKTKVRQKSKASALRKPEAASNPYAVTLFEPEPLAVYPIEAAARMGQVPRRVVLVYCKHGLISPLADPKRGYWFTADAIRTLRRIADLRTICGDDLPGIAMILELLDEVQALRSQIRARAR